MSNNNVSDYELHLKKDRSERQFNIAASVVCYVWSAVGVVYIVWTFWRMWMF